jgi:hypothetical protein
MVMPANETLERLLREANERASEYRDGLNRHAADAHEARIALAREREEKDVAVKLASEISSCLFDLEELVETSSDWFHDSTRWEEDEDKLAPMWRAWREQKQLLMRRLNILMKYPEGNVAPKEAETKRQSEEQKDVVAGLRMRIGALECVGAVLCTRLEEMAYHSCGAEISAWKIVMKAGER